MADRTRKTDDPIVFAVSGSLSPADSGTDMRGDGTVQNVTLTLSGVADDAARQSNKVDLGATWADEFTVDGAIDFTGETPTAGAQVEAYWAPSSDATDGDGNVAGNSGLDSAAPGGALGSITLDEFLRQCIYIGPLILHDGGVVQCGHFGVFSAPTRYGQMIVVNRSGDAFEADNVEHHIVMRGIVGDIT